MDDPVIRELSFARWSLGSKPLTDFGDDADVRVEDYRQLGAQPFPSGSPG